MTAIRRLMAALLMGSAIVALSAFDAFAQEAEDDEAQEAQQEAKPADAKQQEAAEESDGRFFLGPRPTLKRQVGPALGTPRSILPQPYVPKGTIEVPPAPETATDEAAAQDGVLTADLGEVPLEADQTATNELTEEQAVPTPETDIFAGALQTLDPSGIAVLTGANAYPRDFWSGYSRQDVEARLQALAAPSKTAAMTDAARRMALSGYQLPTPADDSEIDAFIKARLNVLAAHGDTEGYLALLKSLTPDHDWSGLARDLVDGHLLAGRIEDACSLAAEERADSNDAFWLRMAVFCRAVQGDRVGVDFNLGILEEVSSVQPTFYQLTDQILVEAEQAGGAVLTSGMVLSNTLKVNVLEATMVRLAKVQVSALDMTDVSPMAAKAMLGIPGVVPEAKLQLIARGLSEGWLGADVLVDYLRAAPPAVQADVDAQALMQEDMSFDGDMMVIAQAIGGMDDIVRADALASLERRAKDPEKAFYLLPVLQYLSAGEGNAAATMAREVRTALMSGDHKRAGSLFTDLRAGQAGDDAEKDAVLTASWPLMVAAGLDGAPEVTPARLNAWWAGQGESEGRFIRAAILFTTLEALGHVVPEDIWALAEDGDPQLAGPSMSPAYWRRLLVMQAEGDKAGALSLAYETTADGTVPASYASSLVGALRELGFETEAHRLAAELLVRRGL
ncbi:hypothetical protein ACFO5Q_00220 [Kordiimonas lipolytica]|uniref:Antifreeze glycopeptide polyprotein n=1 Tax=Kordiimonas lipolytica TaxID=1662421 RepID=A0ABV8U4X9_9PROT|nr:hypothetical protein [Kordiimonas lipolytica]